MGVGMISRGDLKFNCCESVLIRIDESKPLPGFDTDMMRIASAFGGGVSGWGSVCGAVSGAVMALGLIYGTDGAETSNNFHDKRSLLRSVAQYFMAEFEDEFGSVNCMDLLGVDRRTDEGRKRYDELKGMGGFRCDEYVEWAADKTKRLLNRP